MKQEGFGGSLLLLSVFAATAYGVTVSFMNACSA